MTKNSEKELDSQGVSNSICKQNKKNFKTSIDIESIIKHTEDITATNDSQKKPIESIFSKILNKIKPVNFRDNANFTDGKQKLQKRHYLLIISEKLQEITSKLNLDINRKNEAFYIYNSEFWQSLKPDNLKSFLSKVALRMGVCKFEAKFYLFMDELYKQFYSFSSSNEMNANQEETLINLKNGTFVFSKNKAILRGFSKNDFLTYQLPFNFDKTQEAPLFKQYLNKVIPEQELQDILSEYLGYVFIKPKRLKLEKVLFLYGTGSNGKSVLFDILNSLLGESNISNIPLDLLTGDRGLRYRESLENKLLNYASEISGKLESNEFKKMVSGEPIQVQPIYKSPYSITDYAKFMFNCNELPKEVENTNAFFRRFLIIPFRVTIKDNEKDVGLANKIIKDELSGVFNWILEGLERLLENNKFTESEIAKEELNNYRKESDSVLMFLEDNNYKTSNEHTELKYIYEDYLIYCSQNGNRPVKRNTLSKRLVNFEFEKNRISSGTIFYIRKNN